MPDTDQPAIQNKLSRVKWAFKQHILYLSQFANWRSKSLLLCQTSQTPQNSEANSVGITILVSPLCPQFLPDYPKSSIHVMRLRACLVSQDHILYNDMVDYVAGPRLCANVPDCTAPVAKLQRNCHLARTHPSKLLLPIYVVPKRLTLSSLCPHAHVHMCPNTWQSAVKLQTWKESALYARLVGWSS